MHVDDVMNFEFFHVTRSGRELYKLTSYFRKQKIMYSSITISRKLKLYQSTFALPLLVNYINYPHV